MPSVKRVRSIADVGGNDDEKNNKLRELLKNIVYVLIIVMGYNDKKSFLGAHPIPFKHFAKK